MNDDSDCDDDTDNNDDNDVDDILFYFRMHPFIAGSSPPPPPPPQGLQFHFLMQCLPEVFDCSCFFRVCHRNVEITV